MTGTQTDQPICLDTGATYQIAVSPLSFKIFEHQYTKRSYTIFLADDSLDQIKREMLTETHICTEVS